METLIERLAKNKETSSLIPDLTILPVLKKEHEGSCGGACGCSDGDGDGCCGG